ncbi:hypothetical protein P5673_033438 [Acropora cervicornis]|uniref:Hydantoinase/oxoprolinase n=1 Tax=Acropora cervicornis TaxID=6130 RepID=A0AAD9PPV9_ACRCE|nr:hypothetical protein P5673_033438 [Acropora cervicornis]
MTAFLIPEEQNKINQFCAMSLSIGADVGETNTTAVILKEKEVLRSYEVSTTQGVTSDMIDAIKLVLRQLPEEDAHNRGENFERVSIGTTQFENAVKQGKDHSRVALFRLCYPATIAIPLPPVDVLHEFFYLNGGCETDGTTHVDEDQLTQKTKEMYIEGITHIAIVGVYSPKYNDEDHANRIISSTSPEMKITVSYKVCDEEDFLRRERLSIMNESLRTFCERAAETLSTALTDLGLKCPFYFTRSDGKLMSFEDTQRFPVLTLASGLTNSMRGAAFLTGVQNGIVIDIGGTTIHVGSISIFLSTTLFKTDPSDEDQPVIVAGGGAILLNPDNPIQLKGASKVIILKHFQVANAVGATVGVLAPDSFNPQIK